uniref:DNA polymerase III subunit delta' n=1 Tax=Candidatus Kentrum sp. FW TaxID=2126338 RepID=A0A450SG41_9GAMM|nr:MAG: DNA polymerase-3 subunit delta' [Candidatus Kentron sp. FW]
MTSPTSSPHLTPATASPPFPWQARLWEECLRMQHTDRTHHAFLLRGAPGNGKHAFAAHWANALICQAPTPENRPCGRCRGCILFAANTHPDVRTLEPLADKKTIGIDQIRELIDYVWLSRQFASRKLVIAPGAERMTTAAANTLLKTLEEPPGNVVFILISDRSDRLPITIRSRCRFLDFPNPPRELVLPWLTTQLSPESDADLLLEAAGGAPLLALRYGKEDTLQQRSELYRDLTTLLMGKVGPLEIAARWKTLGCGLILPWLASYIMDLIRRGFAFGLRTATHPGHDPMQQVAEKLDPCHGYRLLDRCLEARRAWEESPSLNEPLLLEGIAIDFAIYGGKGI